MKKNQIAFMLGIVMTAAAAGNMYVGAQETGAVEQVLDTESLSGGETEEGNPQGENQTPPEMPNGQTPPEKPDGAGQQQDGQTPPEMSNDQTPPELPDGAGQPQDGQTPPEMPNGQTPPEMPNGQTPPDMPGGGGAPGMPGGGQSQVESYEAVVEYTEDTDSDGETYLSEGADENAVLVSGGASVSITNAAVTRDSEDSSGGDSSSFYGVGAAMLATDGTLYVSDSTITTDADGGAGAFAYGDGTVYIADTSITTRQGASGGIHAAGGGTLYAWNLDVETNGGSAAAIRSDRGGGTMVVDGGSYTSNGSGSPAIYSTADIAVNNADLTATGSEAICIEGRNSIHLFDCDLSGSMADDEQNDITWNVILYQSMSGDSEVGNSTFEMEGGTLTAQNGGMFYTTNTESTFLLSGVDITYADENDFFLQVTGNANARGWGQTGSNGADCLFTAVSQEMEGDIIWDSISQLDFYMQDGSTLTGAIRQDETWAGDGGNGYASLTVSADSSWIVTGDSTLTSLYNEGTITDAQGNPVTITGTDGTVYAEGTSAYTITVEKYEETADFSGASAGTAWSDYAVEQPQEI